MRQSHDFKMPLLTRICTFLIGIAMWGPVYCVSPMEPMLKEALSLTHSQVSLMFTAPGFMLIAMAMPGGVLGDKIGVKRIVGVGLVTMAAGAVMRGMVNSYSGLLASMFLFGIGLAWVFANLPKIASTFSSKSNTLVTTGLVISGMPAGTALGMALTVPLILPIMKSYHGVFVAWSIPVVVAAVLWWATTKEPQSEQLYSSRFKQAKAPFHFPTVLRNRNMVLVSALMFLHGFFAWSWQSWAPTLLMLKGASTTWAGAIGSITVWVVIPVFLLVPRLSYRLGLRKPFLWVPSVVLALVTYVAIRANVSAYPFIMALAGLAGAARFAILFALPIELMPREEVGTATGMAVSTSFIGAVVGPIVGGTILDTSQNLDKMLLILVLTSLAAVFVSLSIPETGTRPTSGLARMG